MADRFKDKNIMIITSKTSLAGKLMGDLESQGF